MLTFRSEEIIMQIALCFQDSEVSNFTKPLKNFSKALKRLETRLEPQCSKFLRIEDQVLRIRHQATVNLLLTGTVCNEIPVALHGCQC